MEQYGLEINRFLEEVFRDILKTEELHATHSFDNLSLRELHLIEAVCGAVDHQRDNRSSAIAAAQRVTAGTLTTVVNQLEKKGYLIRRRDSQDKRSVRLYPTELGRAATREHRAFHQEMVCSRRRRPASLPAGWPQSRRFSAPNIWAEGSPVRITASPTPDRRAKEAASRSLLFHGPSAPYMPPSRAHSASSAARNAAFSPVKYSR